MARYTRSLTVAAALSDLEEQITAVLTACNFDVVLQREDYIMAREIPGQVPFARLVMVEVLVDRTRATDVDTHLTFIAKNEELPLQRNNHCHQVYQCLNQAILDHRGWSVLPDADIQPGNQSKASERVGPPQQLLSNSPESSQRSQPAESGQPSSNGRLSESLTFPQMTSQPE